PPLEALAGEGGPAPVLHSADYLDRKQDLLEAGSITVVGTGQPPPEVYRDLLAPAAPGAPRVHWVPRSERFFPMEYTKLTLEMTSPEYTDLHRALPEEVRDHLSRQQRVLHKGISADLIDEIHELLYGLTAGGRELPSRLLTATAVTGART